VLPNEPVDGAPDELGDRQAGFQADVAQGRNLLIRKEMAQAPHPATPA